MLNRQLRLLATLAAVAVILVVAACGASDESSTTARAGDEALRIGYLSPIQGNSYIQAAGRGIAEAADAAGAELTTFDANGDPGTQINQIQTATSSGDFDGFVVISLDGSVVPALTRAARAGIESVCIVNLCGPDPVDYRNQLPGVLTTQVAADGAEEGREQAEATRLACRGVDPCEVVYFPGIMHALTQTRRTAFLEAIRDVPNVEVVASEQSGRDNVATALGVARDLLSAHPGLDVITAGSDQNAQGAEQALRGAGRLGDVRLIGYGASDMGVQRVADGTWFAGAAPSYPETYGRIATEALIDSLRGERVPDYIDGNAEIDLPRIVTRDNASSFRAEWKGN